MVLPSPLQRGVVTVLHWLAPSGHPQQVFADVASASAWLEKRFESERIRWKPIAA